MKKILFIHQNFPGQFGYIAHQLSKNFNVESMSYNKKSLPNIRHHVCYIRSFTKKFNFQIDNAIKWIEKALVPT